MNQQKSPHKFWAYAAVLLGGLLLLSGLAAAIGYLGLPFSLPFQDVLGWQLGLMASLFLGLVVGPLAMYHGASSIINRPSSLLKLPPIYFFWIVFAVALGLGNLILNFGAFANFIFPPVFVLGAALPTLAVVAWAARRLGWPVMWRQAALAFAAGSTLSIVVAIVAESLLSFIIYLLTAPLWYFGAGFTMESDFLHRIFFSPGVFLFIFITALQAPIPEEIAKALSLPLFGRGRITDERKALMLGLISGAGFAVLENMLYEGLYAQYNGWSWGGITLLRGIGSVLHPLCTAIIAVGWFRAREGGVGKLLRAYALAVGLHTLWNGGFQVLVYFTGLDYYSPASPSVNLYGTAVETLLIIYLAGLSLGLWWLLRRYINRMTNELSQVEELASPQQISSRSLAMWALACALIIIPIGAALGGAWNQIAAIF